jgi:hypothetical protein
MHTPEAPYVSADPARDAREHPTYHAILTAPIPPVVDPEMRDRDRKEIAAAVRALLKSLGVKKVSVTTPMYSMASRIRITLPEAHPPFGYGPEAGHPRNFSDCPACVMYRAARERIGALILAAFPDLGDLRSDEEIGSHYDCDWKRSMLWIQ